MQGASALEQVLAQQANQRVRVFIVWEPVLVTDWMAPSTATLKRISDVRTQQYWDKGRLLSKAMGETDDESIVWDRVAVYPSGAVWDQSAPPEPLFADGAVVRVVPGFTQALAKALATPTAAP